MTLGPPLWATGGWATNAWADGTWATEVVIPPAGEPGYAAWEAGSIVAATFGLLLLLVRW